MKAILLFACAVSLAFSAATNPISLLKSEIDIRRGLMQPISTESVKLLCEEPASKTKPIIMSVFKQQLNTDIGRTLNISIKDAESIADSYIYGAKRQVCPVGFKQASPCGPCDGG